VVSYQERIQENLQVWGTRVCVHGYATDCGICHRDPGQCDVGSCQAKATHVLVYRRSNGVVAERRPCCVSCSQKPYITGSSEVEAR
jgi:hypothetical protein